MKRSGWFGGSVLVAVMVAIFVFQSVNASVFRFGLASVWEKIDQEQMLEEMKKDHVIIVDLRELELYQGVHIPGAINIPFDEFQNRYLELDRNKRIVFVCHTGPMGDASSQFLLEKGYMDIANLKGGMGTWNGPVVQEVDQPLSTKLP